MKKLWKSNKQLEGDKNLVADSKREFPNDNFDKISESEAKLSRRNFFKLMGSSAMLAGMTGCSYIRKPVEKIYPYSKIPEHVIPGNPIYYATSYQVRDEVIGLLVEGHEGRPTKIEGNPLHPNSKGASNAFHQASILDLYDPDRFQKPLMNGSKVSKSSKALVADWVSSLDLQNTQGEGLGLLVENSLSPTFQSLLRELKNTYPKVGIYRYDPLNKDNSYQGVFDISGRWATPMVDYTKADVVVSLNSDFLGLDSGSMSANRDFMQRRRVENGNPNRLYQFENTFSITGGVADHRFRVKRSEIELIAYAILRQFYKKGVVRTNKFLINYLEKSLIDSADLLRDNVAYKNISAIADDLTQNISRAVVVVGAGATPLMHSLVYYINALIKAPVSYYVHPFAQNEFNRVSSVDAVKKLVADVDGGRIKNLVVLGGDPAYSTPVELGLAEKLKGINTLSLLDIPSETSKLSKLVVPRSHYLENWGDLVSVDGQISLVQPQIERLYDSLSEIELVNLLLGRDVKALSTVQATYRGYASGENAWRKALHDGVGANVEGDFRRNNGELVNIDNFASRNKDNFIVAGNDMEITFDLDYSVLDGRFVNNPWMQELPDPISKITWDNVINISHAISVKEGLESYDVVELSVGGKKVEGVIWVIPGQEDDSISVKYGYGQKVTGKVGEGTGFNAFVIKDLNSSDVIKGNIQITKLGRTEKIASVQDHWTVEDKIFEGEASSNSQNERPLVRQGTVEEYKKNPNFAKDMVEVPHLQEYHDRIKKNKKDHPMYAENMSIFNEVKYTAEYQWGMAIDLTTCTGCNACTVACQAENNIPVVGKEMVLKGREMHWIRIDRYFDGDPVNPEMVAQPVTCLQCEQAPCEQVCPVAATVHSEEGLNDMVYNRCIGTRFCSNNCPVKVRRFNYFDYNQRSPHAKKRVSSHIFELFKEPAESLQLQFNPDVTVRMRGVMEKCTYCVQRINRARVEARNEDRKIQDGDIKVACEQACPSGSIVFGNIRDEKSKVSQAKERNRDYHLLAELNIKPRTSYLAAIRNPNSKVKV